MSTHDDVWTVRLHAAVDEHPGALDFDVASYVAAGHRRARRHRIAVVAATAAAIAVVVGTAVAVSGTGGGSPQPAEPVVPAGAVAPNGWVALVGDGGPDRGIHLAAPGQEARRLEASGAPGVTEVCPVWSPDGGRLLFGRSTGSWDGPYDDPELVVVPVGRDGTTGDPEVVALDGFVVRDYDRGPSPCPTWAPDGRWVALPDADEVWLVDTWTGDARRLPGLAPSALAWRPGTDQLAIAGDRASDRTGRTLSTPISVYTVSTGELTGLGAARAAHLTWAPDGSRLAYTGGETDTTELRVVDADGSDDRLLVADTGENLHGVGPVWSPTGDRIVYQRLGPYTGESHDVVLVDVATGAETVLDPPKVGPGDRWFPRSVSWSPDGTTLLFSGWYEVAGRPGDAGSGVLVVPADDPDEVILLSDEHDGTSDNDWAPTQEWGRQPG